MSDILHIDGKRYLSVASAAELYGFVESELEAGIDKGNIRATKIGKKTYVELASLRDYLNPPASPEVYEPEQYEMQPPLHVPVVSAPMSIPAVVHSMPVASASRPRAVLPYAAYALLTLVLVLIFGGGGYVTISRYGPGAIDASYVAAVGVTAEPSFGDSLRGFVRNLFGISDPVPAIEWPEIAEKARAPSTGSTSSPQASTAQDPPPPVASPVAAPPPAAPPAQTRPATERIIERVVERVVVERPSSALSSGITEAYINVLLNQLENKLSAQIASVGAQAPVTATAIVQQATAGASRIDSLSSIALSDSTITGGSISGASVSGTSFAVTGTGTSTFSGGLSSTALNITSTIASSTFANGINLTAGCVSINGTCLTTSSGTVGSGSATNIPFYASDGTTLTATSTVSLSLAGNFGIGTTSPFRKLSVTDAVAAAQFALSYDTTRLTQFQTDASGDLVIDPSGADVLVSDDNLMVCTSGCGTSPSGTGSILAENKLGVGTTTPAYKLAIETSDSTTNFFQIASTTAQSLLVFTKDGRLGLGTSSPAYTLDLWGTLRIDPSGKFIAPFASNPSLSVAGDFALNTTVASSSIRIHDGTAERSLPFSVPRSAIFASSTLSYINSSFGASGTTTLILMNNAYPTALTRYFCKTRTGTVNVQIGNGTASSTMLACTTSGTDSGVLSSNNTFTMFENMYIALGTSGGSFDLVTVTTMLRNDAD